MDESKTKRKGVRVKCPVSLLKSAGLVNKATMQRIYAMSRFYDTKMTPVLIHLVDEAWMDFIETNADSPKLEMILTLDDIDSDTTPLSTFGKHDDENAE